MATGWGLCTPASQIPAGKSLFPDPMNVGISICLVAHAPMTAYMTYRAGGVHWKHLEEVCNLPRSIPDLQKHQPMRLPLLLCARLRSRARVRAAGGRSSTGRCHPCERGKRPTRVGLGWVPTKPYLLCSGVKPYISAAPYGVLQSSGSGSVLVHPLCPASSAHSDYSDVHVRSATPPMHANSLGPHTLSPAHTHRYTACMWCIV